MTLIISIIFSWLSYTKPSPDYPITPYSVNLNEPIKLDDTSIEKIREIIKDSIK
jgi:hypothetical protein